MLAKNKQREGRRGVQASWLPPKWGRKSSPSMIFRVYRQRPKAFHPQCGNETDIPTSTTRPSLQKASCRRLFTYIFFIDLICKRSDVGLLNKYHVLPSRLTFPVIFCLCAVHRPVNPPTIVTRSLSQRCICIVGFLPHSVRY